MVRPLSWHGFLPVGRAKLHLSSLRTPLRMGERRKFRNLLAPSELVWMHKLQAVRFSARDLPFFDLAIDREIRDGDFFAKLIQGYSENLIEPNMMRGLQRVIPCRTTLEVIIPSRDGLSPEQWKDTATLCLLDWPSN